LNVEESIGHIPLRKNNFTFSKIQNIPRGIDPRDRTLKMRLGRFKGLLHDSSSF
jgi:hypothetical protein